MPAYQYAGSGDYHFGIPARDLSDEDVAALDDAQRATVAASPLYRAAKGDPAPAKAAPAAKGDPAPA